LNHPSDTHLKIAELTQLDPPVQVNLSNKTLIAWLGLGLFGLALLGLGISIFMGAPLLVTALASAASAVSITAVTIGAVAFLGAVIGLLSQYKNSILKFLGFKKQHGALRERLLQQEPQVIPNYAPELPVTREASSAVNHTQPNRDFNLGREYAANP
jgi:hypothetical protein